MNIYFVLIFLYILFDYIKIRHYLWHEYFLKSFVRFFYFESILHPLINKFGIRSRLLLLVKLMFECSTEM